MSEGNSVQGGSRRLPWTVLSIVAAAVVGIVLAFLIVESLGNRDRDQNAQGWLSRVERGTSCPALTDAQEAFRSDERDTFAESIEEARTRAEHALDTSGILFGTPEHHAMFLAEELKGKEGAGLEKRIEGRLTAALEACERLASS